MHLLYHRNNQNIYKLTPTPTHLSHRVSNQNLHPHGQSFAPQTDDLKSEEEADWCREVDASV